MRVVYHYIMFIVPSVLFNAYQDKCELKQLNFRKLNYPPRRLFIVCLTTDFDRLIVTKRQVFRCHQILRYLVFTKRDRVTK